MLASVHRCSSGSDLRLDVYVPSEDALKLDLPDDMGWLDVDAPFARSSSYASMCINSEACDNDQQFGFGATNGLALDASSARDSSLEDDRGAVAGAFFADSPPQPAQAPALRASRRGSTVAGPQVPLQNLSTGEAPAQQAAQRQPTPQLVQGGRVRTMPVWMMPTVQHPQGRVVMMPVHFMPAGAACPPGAAAVSTAAPHEAGPGQNAGFAPLSRSASALPTFSSANVRHIRDETCSPGSWSLTHVGNWIRVVSQLLARLVACTDASVCYQLRSRALLKSRGVCRCLCHPPHPRAPPRLRPSRSPASGDCQSGAPAPSLSTSALPLRHQSRPIAAAPQRPPRSRR